jgi:septal ring factor EnvC (AmiA/AmiB activator)
MEDFGMVQGITSIFGFLAVCVVMMWKIVSDKKDNENAKETAKKIAQILEYITTEKEESKRRQDEMQKQIQDNTSAIEKITEILDGISKKMSKFAPKTKSNNHNKTKDNE